MNSSPKRNWETAPPVQQQQQQSDCCCCCCVTSKKWHHTHTKQTTAKLIPSSGSLPEKEKKRGRPSVKEEPPPPLFQPVTVGIGSRAHDAHVSDGKIKGPFGKPWTWQLPHWFGIWCSVQKFLSLAVQLIIGRQPIHRVATFSTYYAIGGFILSLTIFERSTQLNGFVK